MQIPSCHLTPYLENLTDLIDVRRPRDQGGTLAFTLSPVDAKDYIDAACVEGVAKGKRLKYLVLIKPFDEARRAVAEVRRPHYCKPLDVLMKMAVARKFIYREQLFTQPDAFGMVLRSGYWCWTHK